MSLRSTLFPDFVSTDVAALADHMRHCAQSRGPLFRLRGGLQTAQAMAAGRIVTLTCVLVVIGCGWLAVA
jgi:hypothetical protein